MNQSAADRYNHLLEFVPVVADFILDLKKQSGVTIFKKGRIDLVTEADKGAEKMLRKAILDKFPDDTILGEEDGLVEGASQYKWILDPVDGTTNFAHNLPLYGISIGLEDCLTGAIVAGIVAMPDLQTVYHALKGSGAFKNNRQIYVSRTEKTENALFSMSFAYHLYKEPEAVLSLYRQTGAEVFVSGATVIDLCWLAEGRIDGTCEMGIKPWDCAGASVIVTEAGGKISGMKGEPFSHHLPFIFAGNGLINQEILQKLSGIQY